MIDTGAYSIQSIVFDVVLVTRLVKIQATYNMPIRVTGGRPVGEKGGTLCRHKRKGHNISLINNTL